METQTKSSIVATFKPNVDCSSGWR